MSANINDGGSFHDDTLVETHEINVTPFIDVILVLLIVFMVAAPLATVQVPVDLPSAQAQPIAEPPEPVYITLSEDLGISIGDERVAQPQLAGALAVATDGEHDRRLFLRADRAVAYGELMALMNQLRQWGYHQIALVAQESSP